MAQAVPTQRIRLAPRVRPSAGLLAEVRPTALIIGAGARRALGQPKRVHVEIVPRQAIVVLPADGPSHDSFSLGDTGHVSVAALREALEAHGLPQGQYRGEMHGRELWLRPAGP